MSNGAKLGIIMPAYPRPGEPASRHSAGGTSTATTLRSSIRTCQDQTANVNVGASIAWFAQRSVLSIAAFALR